MNDSSPDRHRSGSGPRRAAPPFALAALALLVGFTVHAQEPAPSAGADPWPDTAAEPALNLLDTWRHFGDTVTPDWSEASAEPEGPWLTLEFDAPVNDGERALELRSAHVDDEWTVRINGVALGVLPREQAPRRILLPVPPGTLRDGPDLLEARPGKTGDDVTLAGVRLLERGYRELLGVRPFAIQVLDADSGAGVPARLTVLGPDGRAAILHYPGQAGHPTRVGVQYADADGRALLELSPGAWTVHATRGTEWSHASAVARIPEDADGAPLVLTIAREVDTRGWLSCDTHLHTYTHSGHGDATVAERVRTLAGEGVDVAVATDHNHHTDYAPAQREAGLAGAYLTIVGNEVTTELGHFNAFPFARGAPRPDAELASWAALDAEIRGRGAQVVILNHPRWPKPEEGPFAREQLDLLYGDFGSGVGLLADAIEIFNSSEPPERWKMVLSDWFALRNAGVRVLGVASSDSHTVANPAAQGRTYLACASDDPLAAGEEAVVTAFLRGAATMSQGLFLTITADGAGPGEQIAVHGGSVAVEMRVAGASWADATRVDLFLDGRRVRSEPLSRGEGAFDHRLAFALPVPAHDAWLVALAQGPAPSGGWWTTLQTHLAALSNPILLDGDGDGAWRSPRELASALLDAYCRDPAALGAELAAHDASVAIQAAALWRRLPPSAMGFTAAQALCAHAGPHETMLSRLLLEESAPR
jgi:hypothetical protein